MTNERGKKRLKNFLFWSLGLFLVCLVGLYLWIGPTFLTAWRRGFFDQTPERTYTATQEGNLKALYTALMSYHDSEGHFPAGSEWMDAISNRLHSADMSQTESDKKLVDPALKGSGFGWAFNDEAGGKYIDDVPNKAKTLLLFSSSDTARNAHGLPKGLLPKKARAGGNIGITVTGQIVHNPKS